MIKVECIKEFTLKKFEELKNIQRRGINTKGKLYVGDTFECTKEMVDYLTGNNQNGDVVVKVIEVEPEKTIEEFKEEIFKKDTLKFIEKTKPKKKKSSKK